MSEFIIYWLPSIFWMGFIFPLTNDTLSSSSTSDFIIPIIRWFLPDTNQATIDTLHVFIRKFIHFFEYALLAFLLFRSFRGENKKNLKLIWLIYTGIIAVGYGFIDESLQTLMLSRTGSIYDWLINSAGSIFTLSIVSLKYIEESR
jgi:VanZ family protein